jgi:hypothetical protein
LTVQLLCCDRRHSKDSRLVPVRAERLRFRLFRTAAVTTVKAGI